MRKNIVIPSRYILLGCIFLSIYSCKKNTCYECTYHYRVLKYANFNTFDTIDLVTYSNDFAIDSVVKYHELGYVVISGIVNEEVATSICIDEFDLLNKKGINYKCKF